jgi:hypothetical protein
MRTKISMKKKTAATLTAGFIVAGTAAGAYAYWTTSGSGSSTTSTAAAGGVTLAYSTASLREMYPGDAQQTLTVTVKNTSTTQKGYVAGVKAYITTNHTGCTGADYLISGGGSSSPVNTATDAASAVPLTWAAVDLGAGSTQNATGTIQFNNTGVPQDACQGATVTLNYLSN